MVGMRVGEERRQGYRHAAFFLTFGAEIPLLMIHDTPYCGPLSWFTLLYLSLVHETASMQENATSFIPQPQLAVPCFALPYVVTTVSDLT